MGKITDEYVQLKVKIKDLEKLKLCLKNQERKEFSEWFNLFELRSFLLSVSRNNTTYTEKIETVLCKFQDIINEYKSKGYEKDMV